MSASSVCWLENADLLFISHLFMLLGLLHQCLPAPAVAAGAGAGGAATGATVPVRTRLAATVNKDPLLDDFDDDNGQAQVLSAMFGDVAAQNLIGSQRLPPSFNNERISRSRDKTG